VRPHAPRGPATSCRPLGLEKGAFPWSRGRLFFVAVSEGMWRGLGGGGGCFPTQSGGRGFPLLLHLCSSVIWGCGPPDGGRRQQHPSPDLGLQGFHHPLCPHQSSCPSFPLLSLRTPARAAAGWERRPRGPLLNPFGCLPFFLPGSPGPRRPDASVSSDRGVPLCLRPYTFNGSTSYPLGTSPREGVPGAPSVSRDSLPSSPSAIRLRMLADSWPGSWEPGRLGSRLASPDPPLSLPPLSMFLPRSLFGTPDSLVPALPTPVSLAVTAGSE
jgi:hypothetical protein